MRDGDTRLFLNRIVYADSTSGVRTGLVARERRGTGRRGGRRYVGVIRSRLRRPRRVTGMSTLFAREIHASPQVQRLSTAVEALQLGGIVRG